MPPFFALELLAFIVGLCFGSFLNVCISRLPLHESLTKPPSHCPRCHTPIRWYDNIPLLSFVLLRARCRSCTATIPWRYPLVELAMGLSFFGCLNSYLGARFAAFYFPQQHPSGAFADGLSAVALAILSFLLIGLMVMDWRTQTLPDAFTLTGTVMGFAIVFLRAAFLAPGEGDIHIHPKNNLRMSSPGSMAIQGDVFMTGPEALILGRLAAILGAAGLILLIRFLYKRLRKKEGLGLGDAKLMATIAAFLGFWPAMLALFVGVILCAIYAITLIARGRATPLTRLPLGTFLSIGGLFAAIFGPPVIAWYSSLL